MQVSRWGNSLAVRLPAVVVEVLKLKEGDEIEITVAGERRFEVNRNRKRDRAVERIRRSAIKFPADFNFSREEANER
jgi:antitoxin MazE